MTTPKACRGCGCTDPNACWDEASNTPCFWVEEDLCSSCAGQVSDEEMEIVKRLSLLQAAMQQCLEHNRKPVLIVMQSVDDSDQITYLSALDLEKTGQLLRHLATSYQDTPSFQVDTEIQVGRAIQVNQGPGKN